MSFLYVAAVLFLTADAPTTVAVGQRVRVASTTLKGRVDAVVESFDDATLTVKTKKTGPVAIPWATVSALDVQAGFRRPLLEAAGMGVVIGAVIGLFVHLDKTCGTPDQTTDAICTRAGAVGGSAAAMSLLFFGSQFLYPAEIPKWKALTPPFHEPVGARSMSLRLVPGRHGVGAEVSVRF
jgi:hypothetical protein